jgi:D-lactate dehydrogenase
MTPSLKSIVFYEVKPFEKEYLIEKFRKLKQLKGYSLKFFENSLNEKALIKETEILSVFIYSKIDSKIISDLSRLKLIATRSTGYDHIDLKECKKNKIKISNVPYYGENTVAEHTFALILSLSRNIHKSYVRTLSDDFSIEGLTGFDLKGKTIGVIGGGHIGLHVAKIARSFGMHVKVYDIQKNNFLSEVLNFDYVSLDELLKISDIVTLHVPYNEKTNHLINKNNLKKIKKGAILINTSRGGVVETDALYEALEKKMLGGAGLDVIEGEELIKEEHQLIGNKINQKKWKTIVRDHKIFNMDNVVFTPHNAFNSKEALQRILDTTVENIVAFIENQPRNIVEL